MIPNPASRPIRKYQRLVLWSLLCLLVLVLAAGMAACAWVAHEVQTQDAFQMLGGDYEFVALRAPRLVLQSLPQGVTYRPASYLPNCFGIPPTDRLTVRLGNRAYIATFAHCKRLIGDGDF